MTSPRLILHATRLHAQQPIRTASAAKNRDPREPSHVKN